MEFSYTTLWSCGLIAQGIEKHQTLGRYCQTTVASMAGADAGPLEFRAALGDQASNWRSVRFMIPINF